VCNKYTNKRDLLFQKIALTNPGFTHLSDEQNLVFLLSDFTTCHLTASKFIADIYEDRV
jgi:hypothetical protein